MTPATKLLCFGFLPQVHITMSRLCVHRCMHPVHSISETFELLQWNHDCVHPPGGGFPPTTGDHVRTPGSTQRRTHSAPPHQTFSSGNKCNLLRDKFRRAIFGTPTFWAPPRPPTPTTSPSSRGTIGQIRSGHFWCPHFWVPDPPPPISFDVSLPLAPPPPPPSATGQPPRPCATPPPPPCATPNVSGNGNGKYARACTLTWAGARASRLNGSLSPHRLAGTAPDQTSLAAAVFHASAVLHGSDPGDVGMFNCSRRCLGRPQAGMHWKGGGVAPPPPAHPACAQPPSP